MRISDWSSDVCSSDLNARATVHRPGYMDYIGVLRFDAKGMPVAEQRFLGLYTSSAYNRRPWEIPLVRERHRSDARRVGKECVRPFRSRWSPYHSQKTNTIKICNNNS